MSRDTEIFISVGTLSLLLLIGAVFFLGRTTSSNTPRTAEAKLLIRDDSHQIATNSAKVTIVEFSDFQCPACAAVHPTIKKVLEDYKGRINFVYRHFPLPQHAYAIKAGEAAEAADEQGKFWEMSDKLFASQTEWSEGKTSVDNFVTYAKELGMDSDKFRQSVESSKFAGRVNEDYKDGLSLGINATPTFYLNNEKLIEAPTYNNFKSKIDSLSAL